MQYIATWSEEDQSVVGWVITDELELKFDKSINSEELKNITDLKKLHGLIGVSNCKQILLQIYREDLYGFDSATFLENGDLVIVKRNPACSAYIFSKFNGKPQWACENIIKLKDFDRSFIFKNGKLLLVFRIPFVIMQWNLKTLEFEMQYILNWNLSKYEYWLKLEMNDDNKLLAVSGLESDGRRLICVYSTESGAVVAYNSFKENLHNFCFIGPYLFFSGSQYSTKIYNSYILNPHTLKPQDTKDFLHIYSPKYEDYVEYKIISDFIIKQDINYLSIQRLSNNEYWKSYLQVQKCHVSDSFFNIKEIKQFVQDTLKKYRIGLNNWHETTLQAMIDEKSTNKTDFSYFDKEDSYILENKLLENGDIIFAYPSDIRIYTVNAGKKARNLVYAWRDGGKKESETAQQSIKRNLTAFNCLIEKIDKSNFKYLPFPAYIENFINNTLAVKLYGKNKFYELAQYEDKEEIEQLFDKCFEYSFSMFKKITSALIKLEEFNKTLKVTERFLSKINLLIPKNYYNSIHNNSTLSHLQHRGIYDNTLSIISLFDYLLFWISEQRSLLKNKYPKIYKVLESPYSFYSLYFTNYSQKTVCLMIPLLNFATYPKDYSFYSLYFTNYSQKTWNIKALIKFKWNTYGRRYYFIIWAIYSIFMCCFLIVSTIPENTISWNYQATFLVATILFGFIHFIFEARQFIHNPIFLAFAHSFHLLLRPTSEYSYDQPSNTNDANNPWNLVSKYNFISSNGTIGESALIETPDENTNLFTKFSTSILAVYFMLTGDTSTVTSWGLVNNWTLTLLLVIFSFFTTIYLLNLFISLLGNAINQTNNEEYFLQLRGEILAKIELFWMLPYQRSKKNWFPEILYYDASIHELRKYIKNLKDEQNEEILQDLLPQIQTIIEAKDLTKKPTENLPYDLIARDLPETKDLIKNSTNDLAEDWPYSLIAQESN
ncbi:hypothetical protein F8M41_023131 [Gigaspora margarita]|uniref:Ion transport domain-containing protein n=1 Tax=Gigaspora margarita TaxID=4874 RepID=A0A8H4B0Y3_GIGMA|nr:hypothetical protein F8M41_023131 [Gigaspora margarita]